MASMRERLQGLFQSTQQRALAEQQASDLARDLEVEQGQQQYLAGQIESFLYKHSPANEHTATSIFTMMRAGDIHGIEHPLQLIAQQITYQAAKIGQFPDLTELEGLRQGLARHMKIEYHPFTDRECTLMSMAGQREELRQLFTQARHMAQNFSDTPGQEMYELLSPILDDEHWRLVSAAKKITGVNLDHAFPAEANRGLFEACDAKTTLHYIEVAKFATNMQWEAIGESYEQLVDYDLDKTTPSYANYKETLYNTVVADMEKDIDTRREMPRLKVEQLISSIKAGIESAVEATKREQHFDVVIPIDDKTTARVSIKFKLEAAKQQATAAVQKTEQPGRETQPESR